jgi:uroporphyrinogen-III synthase
MSRERGAVAAPGVVVTRAEGANGPLSSGLRSRGFGVLHWPTIRFAPPSDPAPLDRALGELEGFDGVVFTSPRAVAAVAGRRHPPARTGLLVAAVGEETAGAAREAGWPVHVVPTVQTGRELLAALLEAGVGAGWRLLLPVSAIAPETLADALGKSGAAVVRVEAYRTEAVRLDRAACRGELEEGRVAILTFTSPSTVRNLVAALGPEVTRLARRRTRSAAIGPTTGDAAREAGFDVEVAEPHSIEGLLERVVTMTARRG